MSFLSGHFREARILSGIDARLKILSSLAVLIMVLSCRGFGLPLLVTSLCLLLGVMMRAPVRTVMMRFSEPVFIASIIILLKFLFSGSETLFSVDVMGVRVAGQKDGLLDGLMIAARILGAVSIVAVMGFSTPFTEFVAGLSWLKVPRGFIEVLMFAYRYVFVLIEDAMVIYNAQKNRLGYSNLTRGLSSFGTLAGALVLRAFENSHAITVSMIQRGYDGNMPMLKHKPFKPLEVIVSALFVTTIGFAWKIL
jgi:cobalt/nickel transport system permease protein